MPIHIYKCLNCGVVFEEIQSYNAMTLTRCKICNGELKKQISLPAVHFKGSGFYINDSKPEEKKSDV